MTNLIWLHEDAMRETHPILDISNNSYPFFIWDNDYFKKINYGFNKLTFIYEVMSSLPYDIYDGSIIDTIIKLKEKYNSSSLFIPQTPNIYIKQYCHELKSIIKTETIPDEPFIKNKPSIVDKRFFKYWNKIKPKALSRNGYLSPK